MKKSFLALALLVIVGAGGAFAGKYQQAKPQEENSYTYYIQGQCDVPISCSPEWEGPICSEYFSEVTVYDAPGCISGHETSNIIGKLPL